MSPSVTQVGAGSRIAGRYLVVNHRGGGTDGDVYHVIDEYLGNEVALKLLAPKAGQPATWDEAQILEQIRSEYLLPVLNADVVPGGDLRYITTTLMTGGDLQDAANPRGVSLQQAVRWGQQLGHGLDRVHAANLVHRDVKPGNGFLDSGHAALLGDLGMAATMGPNGSASPYGTFATVAPEVLGPSGRCHVRSDVYSLGATVFYLATGEYPVSHRRSRAAMAAQIVAGQRRKLRDLAPHVSISFGRVVERALSTDPAGLQPDALTLANQLSTCSHYGRTWRRIAETSRSPDVLSGRRDPDSPGRRCVRGRSKQSSGRDRRPEFKRATPSSAQASRRGREPGPDRAATAAAIDLITSAALKYALSQGLEIIVLTRHKIEQLTDTGQLVRLLKQKRAQLAVSKGNLPA